MTREQAEQIWFANQVGCFHGGPSELARAALELNKYDLPMDLCMHCGKLQPFKAESFCGGTNICCAVCGKCMETILDDVEYPE